MMETEKINSIWPIEEKDAILNRLKKYLWQ